MFEEVVYGRPQRPLGWLVGAIPGPAPQTVLVRIGDQEIKGQLHEWRRRHRDNVWFGFVSFNQWMASPHILRERVFDTTGMKPT